MVHMRAHTHVHTHTHTCTHMHTCFTMIYTYTFVSLWYTHILCIYMCIYMHILFPHVAWVSTSAPPSWAPDTLGWCSVMVH